MAYCPHCRESWGRVGGRWFVHYCRALSGRLPAPANTNDFRDTLKRQAMVRLRIFDPADALGAAKFRFIADEKLDR
jgi:hypothetical protein